MMMTMMIKHWIINTHKPSYYDGSNCAEDLKRCWVRQDRTGGGRGHSRATTGGVIIHSWI